MAQEEQKTKGKSASIYAIINAQAGGISSALLKVLAGQKLDSFKPLIDDNLAFYDMLCEYAKTEPLSKTRERVLSALVSHGEYLIEAWKAGMGLDMGTAFMSLIETYTHYPQLLSMYQTEKLDTGLRPYLERYWNSLYKPNIPNSRMAFQMHMEGLLSRAEFNAFCVQEGWSETWASKLYSIFDRDPSARLAFSMYKRGLITKDLMLRCFSIEGYDAGYHEVLYQALHRVPTFREMTNLADYVPLPDLWITEVLRANGYRETDINYIAPAIRMRPLREEIRSVAGRYVWEYQIGRLDRDTLKANLEKLGLLPKELALWLLWADLRYADELIDEQISIIEQRVKKEDLLTREEIKEELVTLGIREEKANLMAELWYWEYIVT